MRNFPDFDMVAGTITKLIDWPKIRGCKVVCSVYLIGIV